MRSRDRVLLLTAAILVFAVVWLLMSTFLTPRSMIVAEPESQYQSNHAGELELAPSRSEKTGPDIEQSLPLLSFVARTLEGVPYPESLQVRAIYHAAWGYAQGEVGNGESAVEIGAIPAGGTLEWLPEQSNHYRFIATNSIGVSVAGKQEENSVTFTFPPVGRIVIVIDSMDPLKDVMLTAVTAGGSYETIVAATPVVMEAAPHGDYFIRVVGDGCMGYSFVSHFKVQTDVAITLLPSKRLVVLAQDASTGQLVPDASLSLIRVHGLAASTLSPGIFAIDGVGYDTPIVSFWLASPVHPKQKCDILIEPVGIVQEEAIPLASGSQLQFHCALLGETISDVQGTARVRLPPNPPHKRSRRFEQLVLQKGEGGILTLSLPDNCLLESVEFVSFIKSGFASIQGTAVLRNEINLVQLEPLPKVTIRFNDRGETRPLRIDVINAATGIRSNGLAIPSYLNSNEELILNHYPGPRTEIIVYSLQTVVLARLSFEHQLGTEYTVDLPDPHQLVLRVLDTDSRPITGVFEVFDADGIQLLQSVVLDADGRATINQVLPERSMVDVRLRLAESNRIIPVAVLPIGSEPRTYRLTPDQKSFSWYRLDD